SMRAMAGMRSVWTRGCASRGSGCAIRDSGSRGSDACWDHDSDVDETRAHDRLGRDGSHDGTRVARHCGVDVADPAGHRRAPASHPLLLLARAAAEHVGAHPGIPPLTAAACTPVGRWIVGARVMMSAWPT